ncbi:MAG: putative toxin-antitoxin system toxin component, PIN family [Thermodesulfobacteriota bacterium]|jgi:uncharacterized protein
MIRIVPDTNIWISAILSPGGPAAVVFMKVIDGDYKLLTSPMIIEEIQRVLRYPKILKNLEKNKIPLSKIELYIKKTLALAEIFEDSDIPKVISDDASDNMILACARAGSADFIISGDHHLTALGSYEGIPIVNPSHFESIISRNIFLRDP